MMFTPYSIIDPTGLIYETGASPVHRIPERVPEGYGWFRHDGTVESGVVPLTPDTIDRDAVYSVATGKLLAVPAVAEARTEVSPQDQARAFLFATDWMIVRRMETGVPVPDDVLRRRAEARLIVSGDTDA